MFNVMVPFFFRARWKKGTWAHERGLCVLPELEVAELKILAHSCKTAVLRIVRAAARCVVSSMSNKHPVTTA